MIKNKGCRWFLFFLLIVVFPLPAAAIGRSPAAKLVLVNLTRVDFADFDTADYPCLQRILTQGQVGLVVVPVAGRLTPEKVFTAFSAVSTPGEGKREPVRGKLGSRLRQAGLRTAFLGNADLPWQPNRSARIFLSDHAGVVDYEFSDRRILQADVAFPFGLRTDYQRLGDLVLALLPTTDLILVETGDLERLEGYRGLMTDEQWSRLRAITLKRIDAFLARLSAATPGNTVLLLLVAVPSSTKDGNDLPLLPLLIEQKRNAPGLLTSPATRQLGLITADDLATLITDLTSGTVEEASGRRWWTAGDWSQLQEERRYWGINLRQRMRILHLFLSLLVCWLLVTLWLPLTPWYRATTYVRAVLPALAAVPLTLLLLAPFRITNWLFLALFLVLGSGGLWALLRWFFPTRRSAYRGLLLGTALVILVDLFFGAKLMLSSLLGPSPVLGHRFYGLGNEYLGILLGVFLLGTADSLIHSPGRKWSGLLLGAVVLLIVSPVWGANFGGGVALTYAAGLIGRRMKPAALARRNLLLFACCLLVGLGVQMFYVSAGGTTHLHNAFRLLRLGAWEELGAIAVRKIRMNLELINYSPWGPTLLLVYLIFLVGLRVAEKKTAPDRPKPEAEWYRPGVIIAVKTGLVAFLANDSGIVVLAPLVLYPLIILADQWMARERRGLFALLKQAGRRCVGIAENGSDPGRTG